jgi:hypothetical protein
MAGAGQGRPRADVLAPPKRSTDPHLATCDKCAVARAEVVAPSFDDARKALEALGWFEAARKGKRVQGWHWWCLKCKRTPATGSRGPSARWRPSGG